MRKRKTQQRGARSTAKRIATTEPPIGPAHGTAGRSAAAKFINVRDLRRQLCLFLDGPALARMARASRVLLEDSATELYKDVGLEVVLSHRNSKTDRSSLYLSAVRNVIVTESHCGFDDQLLTELARDLRAFYRGSMVVELAGVLGCALALVHKYCPKASTIRSTNGEVLFSIDHTRVPGVIVDHRPIELLARTNNTLKYPDSLDEPKHFSVVTTTTSIIVQFQHADVLRLHEVLAYGPITTIEWHCSPIALNSLCSHLRKMSEMDDFLSHLSELDVLQPLDIEADSTELGELVHLLQTARLRQLRFGEYSAPKTGANKIAVIGDLFGALGQHLEKLVLTLTWREDRIGYSAIVGRNAARYARLQLSRLEIRLRSDRPTGSECMLDWLWQCTKLLHSEGMPVFKTNFIGDNKAMPINQVAVSAFQFLRRTIPEHINMDEIHWSSLSIGGRLDYDFLHLVRFDAQDRPMSIRDSVITRARDECMQDSLLRTQIERLLESHAGEKDAANGVYTAIYGCDRSDMRLSSGKIANKPICDIGTSEAVLDLIRYLECTDLRPSS